MFACTVKPLPQKNFKAVSRATMPPEYKSVDKSFRKVYNRMYDFVFYNNNLRDGTP